CVCTGSAVQDIIAAVARNCVCKTVACTVDSGRARERQVLEVGAKGKGGSGLNRVGAFCGIFSNNVASIVDNIGIIAKPAYERIGTSSAVERVVASQSCQHIGRAIARQDVIRGISRTIYGSSTGKGQIFDVVP